LILYFLPTPSDTDDDNNDDEEEEETDSESNECGILGWDGKESVPAAYVNFRW
jgi:hypothetical protein